MPPAAADVFELYPLNADADCDEPLEKAANALQPGDELVLHAGVYSQSCVRSISVQGAPGRPVVIRAADGASVLVTRPADNIASQNNLEVVDSSHLVIRGLRFGGGSIGVRFMGGSDVVFEDNEVFATGASAITMNYGDHSRFVLRRNHIHHAGIYDGGKTTGEGIYAGCHDATCRVTDSVFRDNHIHDLRATSSGGNDGIEIKPGSGGNVVAGNYIHHTDIGREYPCIFVYGGGETNIVENNVLHDCGEGIQVVADAVVRDNFVYASTISGITAAPHARVPQVRNVTLARNTILGHPVCLRADWRNAVNVKLVDNAFLCPGAIGVSGTGLARATLSGNIYLGSSNARVDGLARATAETIVSAGSGAHMRRSEIVGYRRMLEAGHAGADVDGNGVVSSIDLGLMKRRYFAVE